MRSRSHLSSKTSGGNHLTPAHKKSIPCAKKSIVWKKIGVCGIVLLIFPLWPAAVLQLRALRTVSGSDKRWKTSTWTQQTPGAFGNPSPLAYFTQTQLEGKNKFQKVQIILKAAYDSLLQSPQSLDKTKFILDVKTEELICSCIKSSAVLEQNPSNRHSFCLQVHRL